MLIKVRDVTKSTTFRVLLLIGVLLTGAALRLTGISWGLKRGYHPDEMVSMEGVTQLDLLAGDVTAPAAYFEGTFNYYIWSLPVAVITRLNVPDREQWKPTREARFDKTHFAWVLLLSRLMTVSFDVCTILVIFLAAREAIGAFYPALLGCFVYAIAPIQVIYAHFMRPHVLANLLCACVLWLSFKLMRRGNRWLFLAAGMLSGLAAATRYPAGIVVVLPCLCLICAPVNIRISMAQRLWNGIRDLLAGPIWWIGAGLAIGLVVGEPVLLRDIHGVVTAVSQETFRFVPAAQFSGKRLMNLAAIWRYLFVLIPFGMWPAMWIIPYAAIFYLLFARKSLRFALPILLFSLLYLYPMAKGYYHAVFARAAMLLFPGFSILASVAGYHVFTRRSLPLVARICLATLLVLVSLASISFDYAYVRGMEGIDPRQALTDDLKKLIGTSRVNIAVEPSGAYFYTVIPAVRALENPRIDMHLQDATKPADFYLIGVTHPIVPDQLRKTLRRVEDTGNFRFIKQYAAQPGLCGREINLSFFPTDMTYPFPTLLLFRSTASSRISQ
jgi:hypothetical protein